MPDLEEIATVTYCNLFATRSYRVSNCLTLPPPKDRKCRRTLCTDQWTSMPVEEPAWAIGCKDCVRIAILLTVRMARHVGVLAENEQCDWKIASIMADILGDGGDRREDIARLAAAHLAFDPPEIPISTMGIPLHPEPLSDDTKILAYKYVDALIRLTPEDEKTYVDTAREEDHATGTETAADTSTSRWAAVRAVDAEPS